MKKANFLILVIVLLANLSVYAQSSEVRVTGAMREVMWKGKLAGIIALDTINPKKHLFGIGPEEYLTGELLIIDGKAFKATATGNNAMKVEETFKTKAPFFVHANVSTWKEITVPESVQTLKDFENYLDQLTKNSRRPFAFQLKGTVESGSIHLVNLPKGATVSSPEQAHEGKANFQLKEDTSEMVGFFSTNHKGVFTHHDTSLHIHLITVDRKKMGHLDDARFKKGTMKLYLPN